MYRTLILATHFVALLCPITSFHVPNAKPGKVVQQQTLLYNIPSSSSSSSSLYSLKTSNNNGDENCLMQENSKIKPSILLEQENNNDDSSASTSTLTSPKFDRRAFLASTTTALIVTSTTAMSQAQSANAADNNNNTNIESSSLSSASSASASSQAPLTFEQVIAKASKKALSGGKAGASASIVQVLSLMWLRTSMNYQYRYGGTLNSSLDTLYKEGGVPRLYQGLPFALVQGPLTRFGDTAANVGILVLLDSIAMTEGLPLPLKTLCGSVAAGMWRICLMPVDTSKTVMQVEGKEGLSNLYDKVKETGPGPLYQGALASAAATAVGHFPWFLTYNYLNEILPLIEGNAEKDSTIILMKLGRSAFLGLAASCVSDCCSNSLRVIKTTKQTAGAGTKSVSVSGQDEENNNDKSNELSYPDAVKLILETDGWAGLFGRGLKTRLLTNAIQGAAFSVLWKYFQEMGI